MIVIGISGRFGSGKGTVVEYLTARGFAHYSARGFIIEEVKRRGFPINRDTIGEVANDLRKTHGPGFIIASLRERAERVGVDAVIESIHTMGELQALRRRRSFYLFAVDADQKTRYERVRKRGSETDHITREQFLVQENREASSEDPTKQNIAGVMGEADYHLVNNGTVPELYGQIDAILAEILPLGGEVTPPQGGVQT